MSIRMDTVYVSWSKLKHFVVWGYVVSCLIAFGVGASICHSLPYAPSPSKLDAATGFMVTFFLWPIWLIILLGYYLGSLLF